MGTSSSLRPPPDPTRTAIVDSNGFLTRDGWWFLYALFTGAQNADATAVLEAFDSGTETALLPGLNDLAAQAAGSLDIPAGVGRRAFEASRAAAQFDPAPGITRQQWHEIRALIELGSSSRFLARLDDLEKLLALLSDQPPTTAASVPNIVANTPDGSGPPGGTPIPNGTPTVLALPLPSDPLSVVGQHIIYAGVPWVFVPPLSGLSSGFWQQVGGASQTISDTRANRGSYPAANYTQGTAYFETDTGLVYVVQIPTPANVKTWVFYSGIWTDVYANLPTLAIEDRWLVYTASDYVQSWNRLEFCAGLFERISARDFPRHHDATAGTLGRLRRIDLERDAKRCHAREHYARDRRQRIHTEMRKAHHG
jgi:hypothetical protein